MFESKRNRILIVEDDIDIQYLLRCVFESENFVVDCVSEGQTGLEKMEDETHRPDVILLDLMMPVMDGRTFRKLQLEQKSWAQIPTIVMTAGRQDKNLKQELKAFGYLQKPVDIESLLSVVNRAVGLH